MLADSGATKRPDLKGGAMNDRLDMSIDLSREDPTAHSDVKILWLSEPDPGVVSDLVKPTKPRSDPESLEQHDQPI
jgi:hypothetical protein